MTVALSKGLSTSLYFLSRGMSSQHSVADLPRFMRRSPVLGERNRTNIWRKKQGLDENANRFGPLTNLRDYSFLDGRSVPLSFNLKRRLDLQMKYTEKIIRYSKELDFAVEWSAANKKAKEEANMKILMSKLKAKGK